MEKNSDSELLQAWRSGDVAAGEALFARHYKSVHRFFCNKVGADEADDLIQETFLGCLRGRERFEVAFRTYMFGVARKQLLKHRDRWQRKQRETDYQSDRIAALEASPSQLAADKEEQRLLLRALRRLPLDLQVALELFYWEDMRSLDIAKVLDVPHGTARSRLRRGRDLLRDEVEALAQSTALLESTLGNFDDWMQSVRANVPSAESQDGEREDIASFDA
ncbi:MAG: sigma-70 family RNA polymerase sigma factor [Nannocystaceae bacterium]|nr:sigma-70 family RNA polymerase sigma factor [Nannocystaceae bacterium]